MSKPVDVTIIGGGMITNDLILPSVYHLQRLGIVDKINICALNSEPLKVMKENIEIKKAFPGQDFTPYPAISEPPNKQFPELYKEIIAALPPYQAVIVAVPDHFHYPIIMEALHAHQHILCVKPLVIKFQQSVEIEKLAFEKGLFVGIEYHKRFDRRNLLAKRHYEQGDYGEFVMGEAKMIEPYFYRFSNFQNWFTTDKTDPFVYVGCHYVDLVYFITGLNPVEVSVQGVKGKFPNGKEGYMWAHGRVRFENDALLAVTDGLGYPDNGAGANEQCLTMFCEKDGKAGLIEHNDQYRGVSHCFIENKGSCCKQFNYVNTDFYRLVPWDCPGYQPVGYGFDSISATINTIHRIENESELLNDIDGMTHRQNIIKEVEAKGIIATPANSFINELVVEAARLSIIKDGIPVKIIYGENPHIKER